MNFRRTLVIAEGQPGDLLLLVPALRTLKASNATFHITVLVVQHRLSGIRPSAESDSCAMENGSGAYESGW